MTGRATKRTAKRASPLTVVAIVAGGFATLIAFARAAPAGPIQTSVAFAPAAPAGPKQTSVAFAPAAPAAPKQTSVAPAGPVAGYATHIVATHFLRGERYETHHWFKPLRDGVLQGLVFRDTTAGASLIEVEWAISEPVWAALPDWQKEFWHPLFPAVDSGRIRLPDLGPEEERTMLQTVRGLYAQTLNLAGTGTELPVGLDGVGLATHLTRAEMMRARAGR